MMTFPFDWVHGLHDGQPRTRRRPDAPKYGDGEEMRAEFSVRPGDKRIVQWLALDMWWEVWHGDEGLMASGMRAVGPMFGLMLQVDWSGPEPKMSLF